MSNPTAPTSLASLLSPLQDSKMLSQQTKKETKTTLETKNEKGDANLVNCARILQVELPETPRSNHEVKRAPPPSTFRLCEVHVLSLREFKVEAAGVHCRICPKRTDALVGDRMFRCPDQSCTFVLCPKCARPRFQMSEEKEHLEDLMCSICLEPLWEPVQHNECGNSFCLSCLEEWSASHGACPLCKLGVDTKNKGSVSRVPNLVLAQLDRFRVKCSICGEAFERGRLLHHELHTCDSACLQGCALKLPLAQHAGHFALACPMTALPCRQGCGQRVRRSAMESHVETACAVPVACPDGCASQLPRFEFAQHAVACPNVRVGCSRGCSTLVARGALAEHLERQCPVPVPCPRNCGVELAQKDLDAHADACAEFPVTCEAAEFQCAFAGPRRLQAEHARVCVVTAMLPALRSLRTATCRATEAFAADIKRQDTEIKRLGEENKRQDTEIKRLGEENKRQDTDIKRLNADNTQKSGEVKQLKFLTGVLLTYSNLTNAALANADLAGLDLSGANLTGANLSGAHITGARLPSSLASVNLSGVDLKGRDLKATNFSNANLSNADLSNATLAGANLSSAIITGARLPSSLASVNLSGVDFKGRDLKATNFSNSNLSNSNLRNANLSNAIIANTDFSSAVLTGANVAGTALFADSKIIDASRVAVLRQMLSSAGVDAKAGLRLVFRGSRDGFTVRHALTPPNARHAPRHTRQCASERPYHSTVPHIRVDACVRSLTYSRAKAL